MSAVINKDAISAKKYLQNELSSNIKHELIAGQIEAMAGASKNHERIAGNIYAEFNHHLKNSPCEPFASDIKVKAGGNFFYPDVMVVCDDKTEDKHYTEYPVIIIEVLSQSTYQKDRTTKRFSYLNLPSLLEYVLVEQDFVDIEVLRKQDDWKSRHYFLGDIVTFDSIQLSLAVEEIYHRVQNQDMVDFMNKKTSPEI
ncbi:Uma2 family endonuclease [Methyloprofundus sp.]|uniref:Uma2 family endonuclease n=1 Tax=Methyloprofundus sp. TaxID=2020875 RepID=UPI003D0D976B